MSNATRTACAALLFALCLGASPAGAGTTANYGWVTPTVGADENTWGDTLNAATAEIDADLKAVENIATGVNAPANPAGWQILASGAIGSGSGLLSLGLEPCNAYRLLVRGVASTTDATGLFVRFAFNNVYDSSNTYSYAGNYQNTSPTAGTFGATNQAQISLVGNQTLGDDVGLNSTFELTFLAASQNPTVIWNGWFVDGSSNHDRVSGGGRITGVSAPSHIGLFLGAGTFRSGGSFALYCAPHI